MEQWSNGTMDQCSNGTMDQCSNATMEEWNNGTMNNLTMQLLTSTGMEHDERDGVKGLSKY